VEVLRAAVPLEPVEVNCRTHVESQSHCHEPPGLETSPARAARGCSATSECVVSEMGVIVKMPAQQSRGTHLHMRAVPRAMRGSCAGWNRVQRCRGGTSHPCHDDPRSGHGARAWSKGPRFRVYHTCRTITGGLSLWIKTKQQHLSLIPPRYLWRTAHAQRRAPPTALQLTGVIASTSPC
jgi:hypothetical protein